jgi:hypothetical protein
MLLTAEGIGLLGLAVILAGPGGTWACSGQKSLTEVIRPASSSSKKHTPG